MEVIAGGMREDVDVRKNRNRQEEESVDIFERLVRDRDDSVKMSLRNVFESPRFAPWLAFSLDRNIIKINDLTTKIENVLSNNQLVEETEIEKMTKEMAKLFHGDPRLGDHMQHRLLVLLVDFLEHKQNPTLQSHAAIILRSVVAYSKDNKMVVELIGTSRSIVNLIRSKSCEVQVQVLSLLRTIALAVPDFSKLNELIEEAIMPLTSLLIEGSNNRKLLSSGSETLAVFCQVYPQLPPDKLESVLDALMVLIEIEDFYARITPFACYGFIYLCDGTGKMVVQKECFDRLMVILYFGMSYGRSDIRESAVAGVAMLGAIVRWGSCTDIEVIIEKKALVFLKPLIHHNNDIWFCKNGSWVVSNIIAKTENSMKAVIDAGLIDNFVHIIENYKFLDVKKEAAWVIVNAIFGAEPSQIEYLKHRCVKPLWYLLKLFFEVRQIVSLCLRALVRLEVMEVTCNGKPIDLEKIKEYLVRLQVTNIPLNDDMLWLSKLKKLRHVEGIKKSDGELIFHLTCKIQEGVQYPQIILVYDSLEDVLCIFGIDKPKMEDLYSYVKNIFHFY